MINHSSSVVSKLINSGSTKSNRREKIKFGFSSGPDGILYGFLFRVIAGFISTIIWSFPVIIIGAFDGWELNLPLVWFYAIVVFSTIGICELLRHKIYDDVSSNTRPIRKSSNQLMSAEDLSYIEGKNNINTESSLIVKYIFETVITYAIVMMLLPLIVSISVILFMESRGPIIYRHSRIGLQGKEIDLYKFRTMYPPNNKVAAQLESIGGSRLSPLGHLLHRTGLDELPQLMNVLLGNMSLVGPRAIPLGHNEIYEKVHPYYARRFSIRPGITGLSQINGLGGIENGLDNIVKMVELDLWYVKNRSLFLDIKILLSTITSVVRTRGTR